MDDAPQSWTPAEHYDRVTRAWRLLLGEELHYGLFETGQEDLPTATSTLTSRMIDAADLRAGMRVLDVGCGTGTPACRLAREYGVEVLGITTSAVGVAAARERAEEAKLDGAQFEVRDGADNGLPDESFDRVWVMESSHLISDRQALLSECARVLRPGGKLVLCDLIRQREIPFAELRERRAEFAQLRAAFGAARMDTFQDYVRYAENAGLTEIKTVDLTAETLPTFDRWANNLDAHRDEVEEMLGGSGVTAFEDSVRILRAFWKDGTLGYGLLSAVRRD